MTANLNAPPASDFVPIEITALETLKVGDDLRWTGKAKFPGSLRGRSVVVFRIQGELLAIPSFCPHEQANLAEAIFTSPWVLECPAHQNRYDLRTGAIVTFKVEMRDEKPCLVWDKARHQAVEYTFASEVRVEKRSSEEKVSLLESELAALGRAAQLREEKVAGTIRQMEAMIHEVEEKRAAIEQANHSLTAANEFINRVTDTMREVLLVLDPAGRIKDANRRFYDLLGYPALEPHGQTLDRLLSPGDLETFRRRASAQQSEFECELLARNGERLPHLLRTATLYGPSGKKEGVVVVGTDIGQIKAAQREVASAYEKVTGLLDNMRQAVLVVVATGEIIEPVSRFSSTVFGCDVVGRNIFDLLYKAVGPRSEAFSLLRTAFITTFGADAFQWELMEEYFPRKLLYHCDKPGADDPVVRILKVDYCPLRGPDELMQKMMLVVEDVTRIENLEQEFAREKQSNLRRIQIVEELAKNKLEELREFFSSAYAILRDARQTSESPSPGPEEKVTLVRGLHTLKGNARMLGLRLIAQQVHEAEEATIAFVAAAGSAAGAGQAVRDGVDGVQRQVSEYCQLAESVLHIPNDFDARAHLSLHRRMVDLDAAMAAWLGPTLARMDDVSDGAAQAAPPDDRRLGRALAEVRTAAAGVISDDLHSRLRDLECSVREACASPPARGAALPRLRRAYLALLDVVAARYTDSSACPPYSLSKTRWGELFLTLYVCTALALREPTAAGHGEELANARGAVLSAASSLEEDYVSALFADFGSPLQLAALREAWRHLACMSILESLAMVQEADRRDFLAAVAARHSRPAAIARVVAGLRARGGLFMAFLDMLHRRGVGPEAALDTLEALFRKSDGRAGPADARAGAGDAVLGVAKMFVSDRDVPNLDRILEAFTGELSPAAGNALLAELDAAFELYCVEDTHHSFYLKKVDVARQLRTVRATLSGNYQLLFERVQLLNVVEYNFHDLKRAIAQFKNDRTERAYAEIESALERLLDVPLIPALYRHHKMVADIAASLSKSVSFKIVGDDTIAVPREHLAVLQDALVHLVRNAIDHGIEAPEERDRAGKSKVGRLEIECAEDGSSLVIVVRDDGRGIDSARLIRRALELGALSRDDAERLTPTSALDLVFLRGVSTARGVTDLSGRGVGMDIVRTALARIGGVVDVRSEPGKGTAFVLSLRQGT